MPTYDYKCPEGHVFEEFHGMNVEPVAKCPVCGQTGQRQFSTGSGLMFKGSGFYITDYKKANVSPSDNGGKKDAKPETKTEKTEKTEKAEKSEKSEKTENKKKPE